ncbi:MAG: indolepyruvate ferredoxin oxidoreductase family protein [Cohaesibacter sp.]|nr:indolepyruvate ferredoxin oxidoreductase family protein [Cohaesibacter sp.]
MNASVLPISLNDKYEQETGRVYITGIQTLVRLPLDRIRLDKQQGHKVGGFISGYRGSPLGTYDNQLTLAQSYLDAHDITFIPGVNEELAATAVWGSQKSGLAGQGSNFDGVLGIWYGKAPGVDRSCDAFRHANFSGTAPLGGVLAVAGDDPLAKSSTVVCQSEMAFIDVEAPVFTPCDIQDVLDLGLHAFELSRFAGVWTGMIALADMMDASAMVDVTPDRLQFLRPDDAFDPRLHGEMNRLMELRGRLDHEMTLRDLRLPAAKEYIRLNNLNRVSFGAQNPRIGFVVSGKAYRDLLQAFQLLGIDQARAVALGLGVFKVAVSWPLEPSGLRAFVHGLERLFVVEHKRAIMEPQIKEMAYLWQADERPPIWGKVTPEGEAFLPSVKEISSFELVPAILRVLPDELISDDFRSVADRLTQQMAYSQSKASAAARIPYFCSGCPHSSSTVVPDGARVMAGIGCHSMTEATGRITDSMTMMGGEGMHWVGMHAFEKDKHVFANLGDGTYFHSGSLAIRQAVAAKVQMTYKILYNDAVAMTGGQAVDGVLTVPKITHQMRAEGVKKIVIITERPHLYTKDVNLAEGVPVYHRDDLVRVEKELMAFGDVSVLIYDQTCAAEKRRRRKRGTYEVPDYRLFINDRVCEACGDCSVQSNCLSIEPLETDFGVKRAVNQSSCNLDFSCAKGFCPSFVRVQGAELRKADANALDVEALVADVSIPDLELGAETRNILIAGVGGMGVTTVAAVLAMAAHIDGNNASTLDMTGIAQKGGPVTSHVRLAKGEAAINGPRIPVASMDLIVASDLLVAGTQESLSMMSLERTHAVCNSSVVPTADFVLTQALSFEDARLQKLVQDAVKDAVFDDVARLAEGLLGDAIFTNMILVGMAWQKGLLPISHDALEEAVRLNKAAVENNLRAFAIGRALIERPERLDALLPAKQRIKERDWQEKRDVFFDDLKGYQNARYAKRYKAMIDKVQAAEEAVCGKAGALTSAAVTQLYRLMAYKDEYEVARLYSDAAFYAALDGRFSDYSDLKFELAPPLLSRLDAKTGRPQKRVFGRWMIKAFSILARLKSVRGTPLDLFGYHGERRAERRWVKRYCDDLDWICAIVSADNVADLTALALLPAQIKGFGPVKMAAMEKASIRRQALLEALKGDRVCDQEAVQYFMP